MSPNDGRPDRRDILKKLGVGGAIVWSAPAIDSMLSPAAANSSAPFPSGGTALFTDATATAGSYTGGSVELGVVFVPNVAVNVTGVGYYVPEGATGPFTANLWDSGGTLLATAADPITEAGCWHEVTFAGPVALTAGTSYVASYFSGAGFYAGLGNFYNSALTVGSVTAPDTLTAGGNGRYTYSATSTFPALTFSAFNYWVTPVWV